MVTMFQRAKEAWSLAAGGVDPTSVSRATSLGWTGSGVDLPGPLDQSYSEQDVKSSPCGSGNRMLEFFIPVVLSHRKHVLVIRNLQRLWSPHFVVSQVPAHRVDSQRKVGITGPRGCAQSREFKGQLTYF